MLCTKCKIDKLESEFAIKKANKLSSWCKTCHNEFTKSHYQKNKDTYFKRNKVANSKRLTYMRTLKEVPCKDCGMSYPHYIMEFDHIETKYKSVSSLVSESWKKLKAEIAKCEVVCANCHAARTWKRKEHAFVAE